jgi:hypothetical protein
MMRREACAHRGAPLLANKRDEPARVPGDLPRMSNGIGEVTEVPAAMLVGADELERVQFTPGTAVGLRREAQSWALGLVVSPPAGGGAP